MSGNEEPFSRNIHFSGFYKKKFDIFCLYVFSGHYLELFSVPSSVFTTKSFYQSFFNYSRVKRDEQT